MNDAIEKLKAEHAEKLEKAIANEKIRAEVFEALGLTEEKCFVHKLYADCTITLEAETLPDALVVCERMNPLTIAHVADGHLAFQPIDYLYHKNGEKAVITAIGPYIYKLGFRGEHHLHFFVEAGQYIAEIKIKVKVDHLTRTDCKITYDRHGNARKHYCHLINNTGYFTKSARFWSTEEEPNNYVMWVS